MSDRTVAFRQLMRRYPTGVTVVTAHAAGVHHGMTANAVAPVSLDPLLYLVSVDRTARLHDLVPRAGHFVVNMLAFDQADVSRVFADKDLTDEQRWATVETHPSTLGAHRVDGCLGYLDCRLWASYDGGDHTLYVGEVAAISPGRDAPPLLFHQGGYHRLADQVM